MEKAPIASILALALAVPTAARAEAPPAPPASSAPASAAPVKNNRELFNLWAKISRPLEGDPKPVGGYSAGCLIGAKKLPLDGVGYSVMRPSRLRYFGHPDLVSFIEGLGKGLHEAHLPRLLVGDMGGPRGGPMKNGHWSHQIGLDVDLWFRMSAKKPNRQERESWSAESFVKDDRHVTRHWNDRERKLVQLAASSPYVARIFVHPAIKRDLCDKFPGAPWLYKMRPWWSHQDHLHVRLNCPEGAAACVAQEKLDPKDPQCGKELDWWFTADAKAEGAKKDASYKERPFPDLPGECQAILKELEANTKVAGGTQ